MLTISGIIGLDGIFADYACVGGQQAQCQSEQHKWLGARDAIAPGGGIADGSLAICELPELDREDAE